MSRPTRKITAAFRLLIVGYEQARQHVPGDELVIPLLTRRKFPWLQRWLVRHDPATATPAVRHFVDAHIYAQLSRIERIFRQIDAEEFVSDPSPFKDDYERLAKLKAVLWRPWTVLIRKASIPGSVTGLVAYLWHHYFWPRYAHILGPILLRMKTILTDKDLIFTALLLFSLPVLMMIELVLPRLMYAFMRKRFIFQHDSIYSMENHLFDEISKVQFRAKNKKKKEFPLDLTIASIRLVSIATLSGFFMMAIWEGMRAWNKEAEFIKRVPSKFYQSGYTPPHVIGIFDGPFWVTAISALILIWVILSFYLSWRSRVAAKKA